MNFFRSLLTSGAIEFMVPLIAAVVAWVANERRKRAWEEYQRKEENYRTLIRASRGFYAAGEDPEKKAAFLEQVDLCWLYCSDDVITAAYVFLESVKTGARSTDADRAAAFGAFMLAIRKDLLARRVVSKTALRASDHRLFTPTATRST